MMTRSTSRSASIRSPGATTICPSLGGETPLEVALSEGKAIGYQGFELGNKFPRESAALREVLAQHGLELVSGWYSGRARAALGRRGDRRRRTASEASRRQRREGDGLRRSRRQHPGRARAAVQAPALLPRRAMAGLRRQAHRVRAAHARARRASRLSPSHGRVRRDAGRRRPADGADRRRGRPAVRQRPHDVRRRRRGRDAREARRARLPRALQGRAPAGDQAGAQSQLELSRGGDQRRVHRAGRRRDRFRALRQAAATTTTIGLAGGRGRAGSGRGAELPLRRKGLPSFARPGRPCAVAMARRRQHELAGQGETRRHATSSG